MASRGAETGEPNMTDSSLTDAVTEGRWCDVRELLNKGLSDAKRRWVVEEASKHAGEMEFIHHVLPHCDKDQRESLLRTVTSRGLWRAVGCLLDYKTSTNCRRDVLWEASERAEESDFLDHVLANYPSYTLFNQIDSSVTETVAKRGMWRAVGKLLKRRTGRVEIIIDEAVKQNREDAIVQFVLPAIRHLNSELVLLTKSIELGLWQTVREALKKKTADLHHYGNILAEACKQADAQDLMSIAFECDKYLVRLFIEKAAALCLWPVVGVLIHRMDPRNYRTESECLIRHVHPWNDSTELVRRIRRMDPRNYTMESERHIDTAERTSIALKCSSLQLDSCLELAVNMEKWCAVGIILFADVKDELRRWAVQEACKRADRNVIFDFKLHCLKADVFDFALRQSVVRGFWDFLKSLLESGRANNEQTRWVASEVSKHCDDDSCFQCIPDTHLIVVLIGLVRRGKKKAILQTLRNKCSDLNATVTLWARLFVESLFPEENLPEDVLQVFQENTFENTVALHEQMAHCFLHVCKVRFGRSRKCADIFREAFSLFTSKLKTHRYITDNRLYVGFEEEETSTLVREYRQATARRSHDEQRNPESVKLCFVIPLLALQNFNTHLQTAALTRMSSVWEENRRALLRTAVEKRHWTVVIRLSDHLLYDDQREWAMKEAMEEKECCAYMFLAEHALTDNQMKRAHRKVAKHGSWATVLQLVERGADLQCMKEDLEIAIPSRKSLPSKEEMERIMRKCEDDPKKKKDYEQYWESIKEEEESYKERCCMLKRLQRKVDREAQDFDKAVRQNNWKAVLYHLRKKANRDHAAIALEEAVQKRVWHVVGHLVRLTMSDDQISRNSLFTRAVQEKAWGVVRLLLEKTVSVELCQNALPEVLRSKQWILVARMMEYDVDDDTRHRVMQEALDKREGSTVAHIIRIMQGRLTVEHRKNLFERSNKQRAWQAVKPLVEEKDDTGIAQRDTTLVDSVWGERWDLVEHCTRHGADIDKRGTSGCTQNETMLQKAAREGREEIVEGLLFQGANQFVLDDEGFSPLHRAIEADGNKTLIEIAASQIEYDDVPLFDELDSDDEGFVSPYETVKVLVEFQGDINQPDPNGTIPLGQLIRCDQYDIINSALLWGRNVAQRVRYRGRTVLHLLCRAGLYESLHYFVARGCDPLVMSNAGKSLLRVSAANSKCSQKLVAECIKMGVSTFQPMITRRYYQKCSPFLFAIRKGDRVLTRMLYESGSCSYSELHEIRRLMRPPSPKPEVYLSLPFYLREAIEEEDKRKQAEHFTLSGHLKDYVDKVTSAPRSLTSMCRLVISHHIHIGKPRNRQRKVNKLPLPDRMKDYVLFADLVDPDFGKDMPEESKRPEVPTSTVNVGRRKLLHILHDSEILPCNRISSSDTVDDWSDDHEWQRETDASPLSKLMYYVSSETYPLLDSD